jgi:hypothetical protein
MVIRHRATSQLLRLCRQCSIYQDVQPTRARQVLTSPFLALLGLKAWITNRGSDIERQFSRTIISEKGVGALSRSHPWSILVFPVTQRVLTLRIPLECDFDQEDRCPAPMTITTNNDLIALATACGALPHSSLLRMTLALALKAICQHPTPLTTVVYPTCASASAAVNHPMRRKESGSARPRPVTPTQISVLVRSHLELQLAKQ